ncbi:DUF6187 family protein [Amycolatopsis sp. NPDC026612]|uniref:DUF6187 family protein n=1 Tax=Amycolatopsis sp. NPDC026612 TaxID=3155466 RepID=UPI0033DB4AB3
MPDDTRFALPSIDAPDATEVGVILLGLDAERLLAGVGFARLADDPALVTQVVDQARHEVAGLGYAGLIAAGRARWRAVRAAAGSPPGTATPASPRRAWAETAEHVAAAVPDAGPASIAYLTACTLRRREVDRLADEDGEPDVVLEVPAG